MSARPFFGYVVWNKARKTIVFPDSGLRDTTEFVWDDRADAEGHKRDDNPDDEVRRVQVIVMDSD